ncbi:MAG: hypothetical protein FH753_02330 [Firmicutes bacterium]|nr:hypothetical protein [Bacillota bacterium]
MKNKGSTLVFLIIVIGFVTLIGTVVYSMCLFNYKNQENINKHQKNFYIIDSVLDISYVTTEDVVNKALKHSFNLIESLEDELVDKGYLFRNSYKNYLFRNLEEKIRSNICNYSSLIDENIKVDINIYKNYSGDIIIDIDSYLENATYTKISEKLIVKIPGFPPKSYKLVMRKNWHITN